MTSNLRQRATAPATTRTESPAADACTHGGDCRVHPDVQGLHNFDDQPLEDVNYDSNEIRDAETVPVHVAWARVMADVQSIRKSQTATVQTSKSSFKYQFRGIDQVFNAVGPALRRHGVMVLQTNVDASYAKATSAGGGGMRECTVSVTYRIIGPNGDHIEVQSVGEGLDTSDKATTKALTMAYRNLLVNGLTVPTEDPKLDPDKNHLERGEHPTVKPADYRDEITDPRTSMGRLKQIRAELRQHNIAGVIQVNEHGDEEPLIEMRDRIAKARFEAGER